jgi:hypothetical protein
MALGSTKPLIKMSIRYFPGDKKRPARRSDSLDAIYVPSGASISRNPKGVHVLYRDNFTFLSSISGGGLLHPQHEDSPCRDDEGPT